MLAATRWRARCTTLLALEVLFFVGFVVLGFVALSVLTQQIPFFGITDAPADARINKVGLSMQSLRHIMFSEELSAIYAPSPPPPPPLGR